MRLGLTVTAALAILLPKFGILGRPLYVDSVTALIEIDTDERYAMGAVFQSRSFPPR